MKSSNLMTGNGGLVFQPPAGLQSATVFLMHGLGDSADGLSDLPELWGKEHSHIKFILPTAEQRSVTLNMGHRMNAWYDIQFLDDRAQDPCVGLDESCTYIRELIDKEVETGLPISRIMLAGFSQGGAVSLYSGLQSQSPFAGVLALSAYLPKAQAFTLTDVCKTTPVLHCHGTSDPVVKPSWAERSRDKLLADGLLNYELKMYPGVGHSLSMDIMRAASTFIGQCLPPDDAFIVKPKHPRLLSVKELKEAIRSSGLSSKVVGFTEKSEFINLLLRYYEETGISCRDE